MAGTEERNKADMSEYVILTESSCDMSPELVTEADVEVLPLSFTIAGKNYPHDPDPRAYPIKDFYQRMREGAVAVTAAANVVELTEGMEKHLRQGRDVLFLCFSSGLSSTRDACAIAADSALSAGLEEAAGVPVLPLRLYMRSLY